MNLTQQNRLKILTFSSLCLNVILLMVIIFIAISLILSGVNTKPSTFNIPHRTTLDFIAVKTTTIIPEKPKVTVSRSIKFNPHEEINYYVRIIALRYAIDPMLIRSIIQQESEYLPAATNGDCLGLMQVSTRWHAQRAQKLGVTNFYDPYGNILIGVDYLAELFTTYKDPELVLMLYNMDHKTAFEMYSEGQISAYAKTVLARAEVYRNVGVTIK